MAAGKKRCQVSKEQMNKLVAVAQAVAMLGAGAKISKDLAQAAAEAAGLK